MLIRLAFVLIIQLLHKSSATEVTCESNVPSHYCNPTQRNCFVEREEPLRSVQLGDCLRYVTPKNVADNPDRWQCPGCSRRVAVSDVSPTRPVNLTVERSAIRQGKKNTEVYDLTVSWEDPSNDGSDSTNTGYEIRLQHKSRPTGRVYWGGGAVVTGGGEACQCLPPNKTEFTFHNMKQLYTDELIKVEVSTLPYHYLSQDCSTSTVTFFPGRRKNEVLRNPQHCDVHTPVRDISMETSLIPASGGKMKLHLSWNNHHQNKVFFVMVTDPLVNPRPSCRNHGDNPPCFVTNSTNVTIWPLNASRKYHIHVVAAYKCDALLVVEEYDGCGECCQAVEVSPLLTQLPQPNPTPSAGPSVEATVHVVTGLQPTVSSPPSPQQKPTAVYPSTSLSARPVAVAPTGHLSSKSLHASTGSFWLLRTSRARVHSTSTATRSTTSLLSMAVAASTRVALPVAVDDGNQKAVIAGPLVGGLAAVVVLLAVLAALIIKVRRRHSSKPQEENNFNAITITPEQHDGFKNPHVPPLVKETVLRLGLPNPIPSSLVYQPPTQHETPSDTPTSQLEMQASYLDETGTPSSETSSTPPCICDSPRASDPASVVVIQSYGCEAPSSVRRSPPVTPPCIHGSPSMRRCFAIPSAFVVSSSKSPEEESKVIQQLLIHDLSSKYGIHVTPSEMGRGNLPKWVESQCRDATAVLCVCNKAFFDEWEQPNTVTHCLGRQVYAAANEGGSKPEKFTVVLLKQSDRQFIPTSYLKDMQAFIVTDVYDIACFIGKVPPYVIPTPSTP